MHNTVEIQLSRVLTWRRFIIFSTLVVSSALGALQLTSFIHVSRNRTNHAKLSFEFCSEYFKTFSRLSLIDQNFLSLWKSQICYFHLKRTEKQKPQNLNDCCWSRNGTQMRRKNLHFHLQFSPLFGIKVHLFMRTFLSFIYSIPFSGSNFLKRKCTAIIRFSIPPSIPYFRMIKPTSLYLRTFNLFQFPKIKAEVTEILGIISNFSEFYKK